MRITPLDVRKQEFRRVVRGVDADEVHAFLATVADEYEAVLTDNKQLREKVMELDEKVGEYRTMERTLRDTLLTAERVMTEARQNARKEAELILRDAQMRASQATNNIEQRVDALRGQLRELRGQRDAFLARMQSLAEAQVGLVGSYRKDFSNDDERSERMMRDPDTTHEARPTGSTKSAPKPPTAVAPQAPPAPPATATPYEPPFLQGGDSSVSSHASAENTRPIAPYAGGSADDAWRGYDLGRAANAPQHPAPLSHPGPQAEPRSDRSESHHESHGEPYPESHHAARSGQVSGPVSRPVFELVDDPDDVHGAVEHVLSIHEETHDDGFPVGEDLFEAGPAHEYGSAPSGQWTPPVPTYPGPEPTDAVHAQADGAEVDDTYPVSASEAADGRSTTADEPSRWSLSRFTRGLSGL